MRSSYVATFKPLFNRSLRYLFEVHAVGVCGAALESESLDTDSVTDCKEGHVFFLNDSKSGAISLQDNFSVSKQMLGFSNVWQVIY